MRTLSVIGVEDDAILATDEDGEHFRIPVDDTVRGRLAAASLPPGKKVSPREIQAHVRSGMSVEEVAARTGAPVAYVERFVRPVLAERAFVLETAMRVTVQPDAEVDQPSSFGAVLAERLAALAATDIEWTSLKEAGGDWIVSATFRADDVDHRARWVFDPKRLVLSPENVEASTLSQLGAPTALTPRLRAVEVTGPIGIVPPVADEVDAEPGEPKTDEPDQSRFDSAIFELPDLSAGARAREQGPIEAAVLLDALARKRVEREAAAVAPAAPHEASGADAEEQAERRAPVVAAEEPAQPSLVTAPAAEGLEDPAGTDDEQPTVVLTDDVVALRRPRDRAGRRPEPQRRQDSEQRPQHTEPRTGPARQEAEADPATPAATGSSFQRARRPRSSLPSWDEIVYGTTED